MDEPIVGTEGEPIDGVRENMRVLDRSGAELGSVKLVKMGDPEAVTTAGQTGEGTAGGIIGVLRRAIGGAEPDIPEPLAARLLRKGFLKVDGKGALEREMYVSADQIDRVEDGNVPRPTRTSFGVPVGLRHADGSIT
ncbi:hypothetical protein [Kribbella sp. NPDC051137]|uniref:hypothetical protein n=1 Tax=Kribbella sp. NPDC051137 TaxID=3155045 RepID=UPI0034425ADB